MKGKFFLAVVVCLFFVSAIEAQVFLKIDEARTKASFAGNRLQTALMIENSGRATRVRP